MLYSCKSDIDLIVVVKNFIEDKAKRDFKIIKKICSIRPAEEIIEFIIVTFRGVKPGFVLLGYLEEEQMKGKYIPV